MKDEATVIITAWLQQWTLGIDYLLIGNLQARGPHKKPSSKTHSPASPLPGLSLSDLEGSGLPSSVP